MNRLRQDFLNQTLLKLENLIEDLRGETANAFSETFRREAFRALHTIKGTAQTVGFTASGRLAHELENLLAAASLKTKNSPVENHKRLLLEGLQNLKKTFEQTDYEIPRALLESIDARLSEKGKAPVDFSSIPERIFNQLTGAEKSALAASLNGEKRIFCLQINFDSANFAEEFAAFRQTLCEECEIIAALPAASDTGEIGFQILIATAADIDETIAKSRSKIVFEFPPRAESSNRLKNIFAQASAHGESCALDLGKPVSFEIDCDERAEIPAETINVVFDALNQLIRNAIDHAIEKPNERRARDKPARGIIKIDFAAVKDGFRLRVTDDGRGVDAREIKARAIEKKMISGDGSDLSEKETLALIFLPEFSTRAAATEISGRGVGLDAVKTAVEKSGGTIAVESEPEKGTTFEIFLPRENFR